MYKNHIVNKDKQISPIFMSSYTSNFYYSRFSYNEISSISLLSTYQILSANYSAMFKYKNIEFSTYLKSIDNKI